MARSNNQEPRVDSGSTSTNGLTLFKATSSIVCKTIQHLIFTYPNLVEVSSASLRRRRAPSPSSAASVCRCRS